MYAVPVGLALAIPAINYEWLVINEETQLAACFLAFTMIVYKNLGPSIQEALEADGKKILAAHQAQEDASITTLQAKLDDLKQQSNIVKDAEDVQKVREETYVKWDSIGKIRPQHEFKAQVERVLSLVATEEAALQEKQKQALMEEATLKVTERFLSDKNLQKTSLDLAIATLEGKKGAGADPVQAAYVQFFKNKADEAKKTDEKVEIAATRAALLTKVNAVAMNEGFFFKMDETTGKPVMTSA